MRDFTLEAYGQYIQKLKKNGLPFLRFDEYMDPSNCSERFVMLRHDVDRKPSNSLEMAKLESKLGVKSTYYFRMKPSVFEPDIIREISRLGHEIGYHYECLSDTDGNIEKAISVFKHNLSKLREVVPIKTISMHGRPLKPQDNRDMWKNKEHHALLLGELAIFGEVYLDIDYSDIAYINDTGRNWSSSKSNRRDKVMSNIQADFEGMEALMRYFETTPHNKIIFQIHPERWAVNRVDYVSQYVKDSAINLAKLILNLLSNKK